MMYMGRKRKKASMGDCSQSIWKQPLLISIRPFSFWRSSLRLYFIEQEASIPMLRLRIIYNCQTRYRPESRVACSYEPAIIT